MSKIQVDDIVNKDDNGAPSFPYGAVTTGVVTATSFSGDGSNLTGIDTDNALYSETAGIATVAENLTGNPSISVTDITATGNVSIAGTLTYEDVTNVDSIGIITAQSGIDVTGGDINVGTATTITNGGINVTGVVTATSFDGNSDNLSINQQEVWLFGAS
jgi:hypothetical protein